MTVRQQLVGKQLGRQLGRQQIIWLPLLLSLVGCTSSQLTSHQLTSQSRSASVPASPVQKTPVQKTPAQKTPAQPDYLPTAPLPAASITIRADIRTLEIDRLIADCPADSAPYAFAESAHYQVQICSQEYDPWQPKYYIGQSKAGQSGAGQSGAGQGSLRITSTNPDEARQLIFKNAGYTYILYRGGDSSARSEQGNAYLRVYAPNGEQSAEALLYLYEAGPPR